MEFVINKAEGWCPETKQKKLYEYCLKSKLCLEIGVYGGSSLIPMALATDGLVIGIDPWSNESAVNHMEKDDVINREWWTKVDLKWIKQRYFESLNWYNVEKKVITIQQDSDKCDELVADETIDVLHIDGNHTEVQSCRDVELWASKVKKNGYLFFDDTQWTSVQKALRLLESKGFELVEDWECWRIYRRL